MQLPEHMSGFLKNDLQKYLATFFDFQKALVFLLFAWGSKHSVDSDSGGFWIEFDGPGKIFQQCSNRSSDSKECENRSF
jgi:hypothetical protein